jgi:hypothetical protein
MKVLILEDNLMWGPRLAKSVSSFGHEPLVIAKPIDRLPDADVAIVNLGSTTFDAAQWVPRMKENGIKIVAHAGHKEKDLLELGKALGCDRLATNSELTNKIEQILNELA